MGKSNMYILDKGGLRYDNMETQERLCRDL